MVKAERLGSRLERILFLLKKRGRMGTRELSRIFKVSEVTIRNDLGELSRQGLIVRNYGGATIASAADGARLAEGGFFDLSLPGGRESGLERLGVLAAEAVQDGEAVYLDASFRSESFLRALAARRHLTVLTNSVSMAYRLGADRRLSVYIVGGKVDADSLAVTAEEGNPVGPAGEPRNITRSFMGALGLTPEEGFTDSTPEFVPLRRSVLQRTKRRCIVLDSSCWGKVSLSSFAAVQDIDEVITDAKAPEPMLAFLRGHNVQVRQPGMERIRPGRDSLPYGRFQRLREQAARGGPYPDLPGAGKRIALGNGFAAEPFCKDLEKGFVEQALLAGFSREDVLMLDNRYDARAALANMERVLELRPDVCVQFQVHASANHIIAARLEQAGIPLLALEVPVPSATFVGVNNWQTGTMAGELAATMARTKMGGLERLDLVVLIPMTTGGEINIFRTEGFAAALSAASGEEMEDRIVREASASNTAEGARAAMERVLAAHPQARSLAVTTVNHECMAGVIESLRAAGRWDPDRLVLVSHGCDRIGRAQLREGLVDGSIAYFPERYGRYLLPAALALLESQPLPPYIYVDVQAVTRENLPAFYPDEREE